jgi:hypothetical protein
LNADAISKIIEKILDYIRAEIKFVQTVKIENADKHRISASHFKPNNKIWLSARDLKIRRYSKKFDWKNLDPFKIFEIVGSYTYRLILSEFIKHYPNFHV